MEQYLAICRLVLTAKENGHNVAFSINSNDLYGVYHRDNKGKSIKTFVVHPHEDYTNQHDPCIKYLKELCEYEN